MPQISPISWILIVLILCFTLTMVSCHLPIYNDQSLNSSTSKLTLNQFSW